MSSELLAHMQEIVKKCASRDPWIDHDYWAAEAAKALPAALDEIARLQAEGERMAEMFAKDVYIESANLEPGRYDLRLKGKGCMLLAGQLTRMFYDSGGNNFITSAIEHTFSDGKDVFSLTIQKMSGEDTPAQKLERQAKRIAELQSLNEDLMVNGNSLRTRAQRSETRRMDLEEERNDLREKNGKQRAALKKLGKAKRERGKALVEERARRIYDLWFGVSVTKQQDAWRIPELVKQLPQQHKFVSFEPLHGPVDPDLCGIEWIIIGAETGNRKSRIRPEMEWIEGIFLKVPVGTAVFMKDNLGEDLRPAAGFVQEFPEAMQ